MSILLLLAGCARNTQASGNTDNSGSKSGVLGRLFETTKPITVPEGTALDGTKYTDW